MKKILILLTATALTLTAQTFNVSTTPEFRTALQNAVGNGEDDTIILADGTYKTTDDGKGTFIYLDNEIYDLTLIGSNSKNVILSGAEQDQIFNHQSILSANLKVEKLTFLDGGHELNAEGYPTNNGGGFETSKAIVTVLDCNFTNNHAKSGGGFYADYGSATSLIIRNTSFTNNSATSSTSRNGEAHGGGFFTNNAVNITDCNFSNNRAFTGEGRSDGSGMGGGFYSSGATVNHSLFINNKVDGNGGGFYSGVIEVKDSQFIENSAYSAEELYGDIYYGGQGGGFWANVTGHSASVIENSLFHKNIAGNYGGGFHASNGLGNYTKIIKSIFTENKTLEYREGYVGGAGFYSGPTIILDSVIKDNHSSSEGGGVSVTTGFIVNSIISNNYAQYKGGAIEAVRLYMSNSILAHNNSGISLRVGTIEEPALIINSVFADTNDSIIESTYDYEDPIVKINNSYIDLSKVAVRNLESDNIFTGENLGFVDQVNEDYHLTASSDLIDTGTNDFEDKFIVDSLSVYTSGSDIVNYLAKDYEDNNRSVGSNMDIGIYEYSTTKPTINSFTFSTDPKTLQEVIFDVDYTLSDGRSIHEVSFDYLNDDTFSTDETHIYPEAKTYQVTVKVTDDSGEFSLRTIAVIVSALPFGDMTDEQKLIDATNPAHYDAIVSIIEEGKSEAESEGKTYVQNNLSEFGLIDKSTVEFTSTSLATLPVGWSLVGISLNITDLSVFDDASIVWTYNNSTSTWGAYASDEDTKQKITEMEGVNLLNTIPSGSGVWIEK